MAADRLDDPDYPAYTTGRAAEVLGVRQAFLRALDSSGAVSPQRSAGGHRRYSRRQLAFAQRIRDLFDQGHNLASALRILSWKMTWPQSARASPACAASSGGAPPNRPRRKAARPGTDPAGGQGRTRLLAIK